MSKYDISVLEALANEFDFRYPEIYRRAYLDGMLDWGIPSPDWQALESERINANPPLLFGGGSDIELWDFASIQSEIYDYRDPEDYREIPAKFLFVPFAMNGGGDQYVFQFDIAEGEDVPITFIPHDWESAQILAKNFQDFLFRSPIENVTYISKYSVIIDKALRNNILRTHEPYLKQRHFKLLAQIYAREIFEYEIMLPNGKATKQTGFLSPEEKDELFKAEIPYARFDEEFQYMG
jgi:hypothetical protein